jgi:tRNA A37 threonylcarbamoyladenosine modification protein TsaB
MKLALGLSTCFSRLQISLSNGENYISTSLNYLNQEEIIFKEIEKLCFRFKTDFGDFTDICLVKGPGRFTGMRIAYTLATVYSVLKKVNLWGITALDLLAYNTLESFKDIKKVRIAAISHAFKDEFYLSFYEFSNGKLKQKSKIFWLKEKELLRKLYNFDGYIIGDIEEYPGIYSLFDSYKTAPDNISRIIPENIIKAAFYFKKKDVKPIYLKPANFEVK